MSAEAFFVRWRAILGTQPQDGASVGRRVIHGGKLGAANDVRWLQSTSERTAARMRALGLRAVASESRALPAPSRSANAADE